MDATDTADAGDAGDAKKLQTARNLAVGATLYPTSLGLSLLYLVYAIGHVFMAPVPFSHLIVGLAIVSSLITFLFGLISVQARNDPASAHPIASTLASIVLFNCALHLFSFPMPVQSLSVILFVVAAGSIFLSWRWLVWVITSCWLIWVLAVIRAPESGAWVYYGVGFFAATVLSVLLHYNRLSSLDKLVKVRQSLNFQRERAIRSEERFRRLSEASGEGILIHDGTQITDVNPAFCRMFGASAREVEGQALSEFLLSPANTDSFSNFEKPRETLGLRRDGSAFPVEVRAGEFSSQTQELEILTLTDLSERKSAGQLIAEQQRMLFEADKLSALGEMAAGIIHEIRNPLTSILLQTEFLKKRGEYLIKDHAFMSKAIDHISSDATRINRIIHSIRLISRNVGEDIQIEDCPIKSLVMDAVELCRERFNRQGIRLSVDPPLEDLVVPGNPTQILQVLINLLTNSCDAIESCPDRWVLISSNSTAGYVEISITDSGTGVSAGVRDKIMQPFFTTKPTGKGTGLGLSISKKIMEAHRGHLRLDEQSLNTRFIIRLPRKSLVSMPTGVGHKIEDMAQAARLR